MKTEIIDKIAAFLKGLRTEIDVVYCVEIENIDLENPYDSIYDMIENNNGFDVEIIYYSNAMKYLMNNDNSLIESLEIASELGYTPENLNSEILASLLASQNSRSDFSDLQVEIEEFFEEIKNENEESKEE
jgi:hypothetical protein